MSKNEKSQFGRKLATASALAALAGFTGVVGPAEAEMARVDRQIESLRSAAETGVDSSHAILDATLSSATDALRAICHSQGYSQSAGHNQSHGQSYEC